MLFLYIFAACLLGCGAWSQVIAPLVSGRPAFPLLRRSREAKMLKSAGDDLKKAQLALAEAEKRKQAAELHVQAATIEAETAELEMKAHDLRENMLSDRIGGGLALTDGSETPPNGDSTKH